MRRTKRAAKQAPISTALSKSTRANRDRRYLIGRTSSRHVLFLALTSARGEAAVELRLYHDEPGGPVSTPIKVDFDPVLLEVLMKQLKALKADASDMGLLRRPNGILA
jgi:hypothetical protein